TTVRQMLAEEKAAGPLDGRLADFSRRVVRSKLQLHALLRDLLGAGARMYGVGAPSRASTLINYAALDRGMLECVVEVTGSYKAGKYMPGTMIPVVDEARLFADQPELALLLSWHIAGELMPKLAARGFNGRYVVPLPDRYFQGPYILNTYGGVLNLPGGGSYVGRVHRDQRTFSGDLHLMVQLLVMLDGFTEENGATWLLAGSHRMRDKPSDDEFFAGAVRAVGPAGSIVVFDSNLWHAAGVNRSGQPRRALTLAFTRPFIKQQLDYPRALGDERRDSFSPVLRQLLGYNARV